MQSSRAMTTSLRFEAAPPMWGIERPARNGASAVLRVGAKRLAIADIRSISREVAAERDINGLIFMGAAFMFASVFFMVGVIDGGWRERFLIAAAIFFGLAFVSLTESFGIRPVRYVRLRIATASGDVVFTTPDQADADALEQRIAEEQSALLAAR